MPILKRTRGFLVFLAVLALLIRLVAVQPDWVEDYYSSGLYPVVGRIFRWVFGWLPFSLGDLIYMSASIYLLYQLYFASRQIRSRKPVGQLVKKGATWLIAVSLIIYISFNLFWGLNYNRRGIAWQMKLTIEDSISTELSEMTAQLRDMSIAWRPLNKEGQRFVKSTPEALIAYRSLQKTIPWLAYHPRSVKPSLFGKLGNYMGYSGYYNPFSGEAQLNTHIPGFLLPFSTCHEIAHQLGYAKENEANFVGYLAARESMDSALRYSAYLSMFLYANNELRFIDSSSAKRNFEKLSAPIKKDLAEYRRFLITYRGPIEDFVDAFYHQFLRFNQQPAGRRSYNKVVLWLLAFYKERGSI